jgi:hypothetical protein
VDDAEATQLMLEALFDIRADEEDDEEEEEDS